jgi:cyclophilin family peptidyl-prolyl cis-trans isomerase
MIAMLSVFFLLSCSDNDSAKNEIKPDGVKPLDHKTEAPAIGAETDSLISTGPKIRDAKNPIVTLSTDFGDMTLELYHDVAPIHVDSFLARTNEGFYNGLIFHRIWSNFMIQGGDSEGTGRGKPKYYLKAEFSDLPHIEGTLSMARSSDPNSASTQFFICLARNAGTEGLDGKYTVFGQLLKGYDALHAIGKVKCTTNPTNPSENTKPVEDVVILKAYRSDIDGNPL